MSEAKHTHLPWSACCGKCHTIMSEHGPVAKITVGNWGDDYPSVRLVGDSSLDIKAEPYMAQITYGHVDKETAVANAAFIVRAVNAHDDLVAACRDALDALEGLAANRDTNLWCRQLRAALAKAEAS